MLLTSIKYCMSIQLTGSRYYVYNQEHGGQSLRTPTGAISRDRGGSSFIRKTARSSASCDGSRQAGLNTAIESFWRCILVEIYVFLLTIRGLWRSPGARGFQGVPGASPGVSGTSLASPKGVPWSPRRVPRAPRDVPRGSPGS